MRAVCIQRHAINAGKSLKNRKRKRKEGKKTHSGFDYVRNFGATFVLPSYKTEDTVIPEDEEKDDNT